MGYIPVSDESKRLIMIGLNRGYRFLSSETDTKMGGTGYAHYTNP